MDRPSKLIGETRRREILDGIEESLRQELEKERAAIAAMTPEELQNIRKLNEEGCLDPFMYKVMMDIYTETHPNIKE